MVLIKGGQMKQKIIKPGVVRRIAEKIADEGINIPKETVDICLTAFLDTVADILSEGDSVVLKGYMNIYPKLLTLSIPFTLIKEEFYEAHKSLLQAINCYLIKTEHSEYLYCFTITQTF